VLRLSTTNRHSGDRKNCEYSIVPYLGLLMKYVFVVCFLLGNSPASEFYVPTFWNTLSVPSS